MRSRDFENAHALGFKSVRTAARRVQSPKKPAASALGVAEGKVSKTPAKKTPAAKAKSVSSRLSHMLPAPSPVTICCLSGPYPSAPLRLQPRAQAKKVASALEKAAGSPKTCAPRPLRAPPCVL